MIGTRMKYVRNILAFIKRYIPVGKVLIMEYHPKNQERIKKRFRKWRMRTVWVGSYEEAKAQLLKEEFLGVVLDHKFRNDPDHRGYHLLRYIRRENEDLVRTHVYLVTSVETADLMEYEYLKLVRYYDTEMHTIGRVVDEIAEYIMPRD